jgi:polyhydroxybutyrate depolymerase
MAYKLESRTVTLSVLLALTSGCDLLDVPELENDAGQVGNTADANAGSTRDASSSAQADAGVVGEDDADSMDEADASEADAGEPQPSKSTGPGDWVAGDYPPGIKKQTYLKIADLPGSKGAVRQYKVHVPPSYDPQRPMPAVFCFHGLGQSAVSFCVGATGLPAKSDEEGFILVMPTGVDNSWSAGTCCSDAGLDEIEFIRAVFDEISTHLNIDLGRVYATGLSNGGYLSYRVGCELSDVFVAIAPGSAAIGIPSIGGGTNAKNDFARCEPKERISVLDLHGTSDPLIPFRLQKASLDLIAKSNGCSLDTVPAELPVSGGDTTCITYTGCPTGIEVTGCAVAGGGHCWFGDASGSCGTGAPGVGNLIVGNDSNYLVNSDVAWEFFERVSR